MSTHALNYPSVAGSEQRMLDDVARILAGHRIDPETARCALLVISEAFTNALVHGNQWDPAKQVKIDLQVKGEEIVADIGDEGHGGLKKILASKPAALFAEGGRGIDLMRHWAASVEFYENRSGGLTVSIRMGARSEHETKA